MAPNNNRGIKYKNDEEHLSKMKGYFVGVVNIVFNWYNNWFLLIIVKAKSNIKTTLSVNDKIS